MPLHDWTKVEAVIFHDFQSYWIQILKHALNNGLLPDDYYAITERANILPEAMSYKQSRLSVRQTNDDQVVAAIEIVSPRNTDSKHAIRAFVSTAVELLAKRIHLNLIELLPPTPTGFTRDYRIDS